MDSDDTNKIRNYNPHKYDLIRKLMNPYIKSVEKIGDSEISIHEKRKTLQKTQVGETVINLITEVILPYLNELKWIWCMEETVKLNKLKNVLWTKCERIDVYIYKIYL